MTMPNERLRSICWGSETLADIAADTALDGAVRVRAQTLLRRHPTQAYLAELLAAGRPLSASAADALRDTRMLLEGVRYSGAGSTGVRQAVVQTLRHYPDTLVIKALRQAEDLRAWLADEVGA